MYYSINLDKLLNNKMLKLKTGDQLLYRRFSFRENFPPEVIVIDIQKRYNARSRETKSNNNLNEYAMIQCIDSSEVELCSEESTPEYYL